MKHYVFALVCLIVSVNLLGTSEKKAVFHPNGYKRYEYEVNGIRLNGMFVGYYESGQVKVKGYLKNNRKTGLWTAWHPNGVMHSQRKYREDDSFEIIHEWDTNGNELVRQPATASPEGVGAIGAAAPLTKPADTAVAPGTDLYELSNDSIVRDTAAVEVKGR